MKKVIIFLIVSFLIISCVNAEQRNQEQDSSNEIQLQQNASLGERGQIKTNLRIREGDYTNQEGKPINIELRENRIRLKIKNISAHTYLNITKEQIKDKIRLRVKLSNGKNSEIKIMPDTASETALERLRLKVCSEVNNCEIQLKEVGQRDKERIAYELKAEKQFRIFGLFKKRMNIQAQVDAETGEIIKVKRPWWSFLASEQD